MRVSTYIFAALGLGALWWLVMKNKTVANALWSLPASGEPYAQLFADNEQAFGLPHNLLARIAWQESRFDPKAYNAKSGAAGMMQLIPRFYPGVDPYDPNQAIPAAAGSLSTYFDMFDNWQLAIASYNWGPGNVQNAVRGDKPFDQWPQETQSYVAGVAGDLALAGPLVNLGGVA